MAMAGVANGRERVVGEPAGFVFQDTENEEGNWLPAATLFAAAGPPVVVLDRADHLQVERGVVCRDSVRCGVE